MELKEKTVTRAFKTISPFFKLYASYARSHEKALKTLMVSCENDLRKNHVGQLMSQIFVFDVPISGMGDKKSAFR